MRSVSRSAKWTIEGSASSAVSSAGVRTGREASSRVRKVGSQMRWSTPVKAFW